MNTTPTPETDAAEYEGKFSGFCNVSFARKLERERDEARLRTALLINQQSFDESVRSDMKRTEIFLYLERDHLRAELAKANAELEIWKCREPEIYQHKRAWETLLKPTPPCSPGRNHNET
jgi:hypothetical protein